MGLTVEPISNYCQRTRNLLAIFHGNAETVQHLMINSPTCLHLDICQKCLHNDNKKKRRTHFSEPGPTHPFQFIALDTNDFLLSKNLLFFFFLLFVACTIVHIYTFGWPDGRKKRQYIRFIGCRQPLSI